MAFIKFLDNLLKSVQCSGPCQEEKRKWPGKKYKPLRDRTKQERHNPNRSPKE